jgi:hypothetical protein
MGGPKAGGLNIKAPVLIMAGLLKPANSLLQRLTESSQPNKNWAWEQAVTGKIGIISGCFHRGSLKIHFKLSWAYQVKNLKTISSNTQSTDLILYQLTSKPISGETVPVRSPVFAL